MSSNSQAQEIDLGQFFSKVSDFLSGLVDKLFDFIFFLIKKSVIIIILLVIGVGLGYYLDKSSKVYNHEIIVSPNFGSVDYLYAKVNLLEAKRREKDSTFITGLGIKNVKKIGKIEIEPVIDVYKFVTNKPENFDLIKLMAEDGSLEKIIKDDVTSKNYPFHLIKFSTTKTISLSEVIDPMLQFINDSEYYNVIKKQYIENTTFKMNQNDSTISQINTLLSDFSKTTNGNQKNSNLVYYNENNNLNDIIKTKDELIQEQGDLKMRLINNDKIIKEINVASNMINTKGANGKMKLVLPILFVFMFLLFHLFRNFYVKQLEKRRIKE
jgi:uncharacterized membrane protein